MKKIGIDARLIGQTGVGVYTYNLLKNIESLLPAEWTLYVYLRDEDWDSISFSSKQIIKRKANYHWHTFAEQIGFYLALMRDDLDLMHFTYFSYPVFYRGKFVSTIHDLIPILYKTGKASTKSSFEYYPKFFAMKHVIGSAVRNARALIVPTRHVKSQLLSLYKRPHQDKVYCVPEGFNKKLLSQTENNLLNEKFKKNFFLYVGNFYPHKNVSSLVEAFSHVKGDMQLVLVGPDDFFFQNLNQEIIKLGQSQRIVLFKNARPEDLVYFYRHAQALIHPSFEEGFGLTLLEAMHFGLPVIASKIPVFEEVYGNNFVSFNPHDMSDITKTIEEFLIRPKKFNYDDIVKKYSFEKMTEETVSIYKKILA